MRLFYATTNPGKLFEVGKYLKPFGIDLIGPEELGLSIEVPEAGSTLEENARLKAHAYINADVQYPVLADDTGIEIDALDGEPGIHVRRWKNKRTRMTDQEIIDYCLRRMKGIPREKRTAEFRTIIALGIPKTSKGLTSAYARVRPFQASVSDVRIELFDGTLRGVILEKPVPLRIEGLPFESLFYIPEWKKVLGEVHQLPAEKKRHFLTHRERAVKKALPRIRVLSLGNVK